MASLKDTLDRIREKLKKAKDRVGTQSGPLTEPDLTDVATYLDEAEDHIDTIYDPNTPPNLDPVDAGASMGSYQPTTLTEYARDCALLAKQAHDESEEPNPDDDKIGDRLKTIEGLLPGYRSLAGIT